MAKSDVIRVVTILTGNERARVEEGVWARSSLQNAEEAMVEDLVNIGGVAANPQCSHRFYYPA